MRSLSLTFVIVLLVCMVTTAQTARAANAPPSAESTAQTVAMAPNAEETGVWRQDISLSTFLHTASSIFNCDIANCIQAAGAIFLLAAAAYTANPRQGNYDDPIDELVDATGRNVNVGS